MKRRGKSKRCKSQGERDSMYIKLEHALSLLLWIIRFTTHTSTFIRVFVILFFCFIFLNQGGLEHRKSYLRQAVPQTMLTCIVINTPNLVGYTWVECSIRDGPGQTIRDLKTDHTCTAHCQNYFWLPKVEGPPMFVRGLEL